MKICPECKTENKFDGAQFCQKCGGPLKKNDDVPVIGNPERDDELRFEVTETAESAPPQLFGDSSSNHKLPDEERLEIEDNANLLGDDQIEVQSESEIPTDKLQLNNIDSHEPQSKFQPQPQSPSPDQSDKMEKREQQKPFKVDWGTSSEKKKEISPQNKNMPEPTNELPSAEEFSKGRKDMMDDKKPQTQSHHPVAQKVTNSNNSKIREPQISDSKITKSSRVKGIAYFFKNIVQLAGNPFLHENDEIIYKNKPYRLKPYRISKKAKFTGIAAMFVLLSLLIGSQIIGPALPGHGQVVGIVLDESGQPYLGGASIYIPKLDKSITSNALGFFRFDNIPTGSYELIYRLEDELEGKENITVTAGSMTMRSFGNFELMADSYDYSSSQKITEQKPVSPPTKSAKKKTVNIRKKSTSKKILTSGYGKIKLVANVEGAKFVVDGKTLGAGNNIFTEIKTGKRKVQVSKPGYTEYTEIISVSKNRTQTVRANLSRKASDEAESLTANDYFNLGNDAFVSEKYESAISDLTKAIELSPNHVDAYGKRAQAFVASGNNEKAANDYIRIGEIYGFKKQNGRAISQFTSALKYSPNNTTALVGRAGVRMNKGEYRSALFDYTRALEIDNRFYPAFLGAGIAEYKLGDNKNAEKYFKKAKKLNKSDSKLYHYLMLNYLARDNIKQMKKAYAQFKDVAGLSELAEFKASSRFAPVIRLLDEDDI